MRDKVRTEFWGNQLDAVMSEIAREAAICQVKLLDPGVIEAVLNGNDSVCGHANSRAFKKLQDLLMIGFVVRDKAFDKLGPGGTPGVDRRHPGTAPGAVPAASWAGPPAQAGEAQPTALICPARAALTSMEATAHDASRAGSESARLVRITGTFAPRTMPAA